jgi:thiamine biosynthesis lipoprotein
MNRRALVRNAGHLVGPWLDLGASPPPPAPDVSLLRFSRQAMATTFELLLPVGTRADAAADVFELIDDLEAQLTVYRDDSEVSVLNQNAANGPVPVEERLFELLAFCAETSAETSGAFDVTAGSLIKAWGFFRRQGRVPTPAERQGALECVGMRHVDLDRERRTVRFRRPGVELNLGSVGKGYALDRCSEVLRTRGVRSALLHGGGSSVAALGCQPNEPRGWPVGICHPWREGRLGVVYLRDRALGTSAATYQHFEYNRKRLGHLLDPRTGRPAEGIASATAVATTAATADALATAFYVLGVEKTRLYCQAHPEVGALLLPDGEETRPMAFGLTANDFTPDERGPK